MDQPDYTKSSAQHGLGLQCVIALTIGVTSLITFSVWRKRWPKLYASRTFRRDDLPSLGNTLFGWVKSIHLATDNDVLECAGLDAFVFLQFFKAAAALLAKMTAISFVVISPLRWYFTGRYDDDTGSDQDDAMLRIAIHSDPAPEDPYFSLLGDFSLAYVVFSYVFTFLVLQTLASYTRHIVRVRQDYLKQQNSITDRTLRINSIPNHLQTSDALSEFLGQHQIVQCYDWSTLDMLCRKRKRLLRKLERLWGQYLSTDPTADLEQLSVENPQFTTPVSLTTLNRTQKRRPRGRVGFLFTGPEVDLIDYYTVKLEQLDERIEHERQRRDLKPTDTIFVTMKSVAACQLGAQAVLSQNPHQIKASLAPAPHDVIWSNLYISRARRMFLTYAITSVFILSSAFMVVPLTYLAGFLDMGTIRNFLPRLADWLEQRDWMIAFVTQVLPTFVYTFFNFILPYFYAYLSTKQGFISSEDIELSTLSKNFFYVFVNLFLVFTIATNYMSLLRDTTQIAVSLAHSLRRMSTFYTNLIVLQGIGLTPVRLLQPGSTLQFPFLFSRCQSVREFHDLFKPQELNYGILLPTPLLIFILVMLYSVLSSKILFFGTIYFVVGYYVAKYQVLYSMVHVQHSTGRLWTLIMRRIYFGLVLFEIVMIGVLVLESAFKLVPLLIPLPFIVASTWYDFEMNTEPLLRFIALEVLQRFQNSYIDEPDISHARSVTLDESRELGEEYENPNLKTPLDGPLIAIDDGFGIFFNREGPTRRRLSFSKWN